MKDPIKRTPLFKIACFVLLALGAGAFVYGFIREPDRTWANYLLNNYYFLSLSLGAAFFYALQYITQSGWSAGFKRIPEAFMSYIPVAAVFFILLYFGMKNLYHWTHPEAIAHDELIAYKSPYLNVPFFYIRLIVFFGAWILMTRVLRRQSLKEDETGELKYFHKLKFNSRILIFILAISMSLAAIDWIKSIDVHWFSTIFAVKNFVMAFYHASAIIFLTVFILYKRGYFSFLNGCHLHDFTRYIFILAIIWGYLWFAQFMLIWYGNIPEETVYYVERWQADFKVLFYVNILINWFIPFVVLLPTRTSRNMTVITAVILLLIPGQYIDLYLQIMPGTMGRAAFGFIEAGTFLGYAGLFALVAGYALSRAPLIAKKHPYLEESLQHQF